MKLNHSNWQAFIKELSRRKVVQVIIAYVAFAWLLIQVADVLADAFEAPSWMVKALFIILVVGLPITGILAWVFDITSHGVEKTKELPHPSTLDIKAIPIIFHASFDKSVDQQRAAFQFKDYCLWAEDYQAVNHVINEQDCIILFSNSIDAMRYAIRIQNHSQSLELPLKISIIEAPDNYTSNTPETQKFARARALAVDSQLGGIVITAAVKKAIKNRGIESIEKALHPLKEQHSKIEQNEFVIDPEQIHAINLELQEYSDTVLYYKTPIALKLAALAFLTIISGVLWTFIPTLEHSENSTIAILPFKNSSSSKEHEDFVNGFSEDIFMNIAQIPGLNIVSRRASQNINTDKLSPQEIGDILNTDLLIEGSVIRNGNNIRVSMWITDSDSGIEKWNKIFNMTTSNILLGNRTIIQSLANFFENPVDAVSLTKVSENPNEELYPQYLKAKGLLKKPPTVQRLLEVEQIFRAILSEQKGFLPAMAGLCKTYLLMYSLQQENYQFQQAEDQCLQAYAKQETNLDIINTLIHLHTKKGDFEQAEHFAKIARSINPSDTELLSNLSQLSKAQGDQKQAIEYLEQAIAIEPGYWLLSQKLGNLYLFSGQWDKAIERFKRVTLLIPEDAHGYVNLGTAYFFKGDFEQAALTYEQSLEYQKDDVALSNIATMWFYHGDYTKAKNYYLQAIQLTPNSYVFWLNLADTKIQQPNYSSEALAHYQHAINLAQDIIAINPNDAEARIALAWCNAQLNNKISAENHMNNALSLSNQDPSILFLAAKTAAKIGDIQKGQEFLQQSIELGFPLKIIEVSPFVKQLNLYSQKS
ncbi:MAG: tetratricopeptide repeat protein [Kangiellaceae bacterium]|nr:tetratricopeptide repeat protein [Kangiellaceae bacterium]